ncbi:MAG: sugar transferase [Phormidesmis sp. CAN_BIN36]|nr:sugar transferase [Phormidesmis sp. CAN_BIN36]
MLSSPSITSDRTVSPLDREEKYVLIWRLQQLIVRRSGEYSEVSLPHLDNLLWLVDCLRRSPVRVVRLDITIGESVLKCWADACQQARKPVFVRTPTKSGFPHTYSPIDWWFKRAFDRVAAAGLLVILSPILLLVMGLIRYDSPGSIFYRQWRVGERGRLFQIIKFRTMVVDADQLHHQLMQDQNGLHKLKNDPRVTRLGRWLRKYSIDELPQLINVLRGEMSLVGPRPWALYDAVRISPELQHRLNALPGITGAWQVQARSTQLDLSAVNRTDLHYLENWSLQQDFKFLLLTIPKVLSGFGAY